MKQCENQSNSCGGRLRWLTVRCGCDAHSRRMLVCASCRDSVAEGRAQCTPCGLHDGEPCPMIAPGLIKPDWVQDIEDREMFREECLQCGCDRQDHATFGGCMTCSACSLSEDDVTDLLFGRISQ